ncbi:MAG: TolC family outer membrane protein [Pseudomonadales bacterium]|nr:TolC family outer membrane protein [Pseudomonadales bacterium]
MHRRRKSKLQWVIFAMVGGFSSLGIADNLQQLTQEALQQDPRVKSSEFELEIRKAQDDQAFGQVLPQVRASSTLTQNQRKTLGNAANGNTKDDYTGERYTLSASQVLFNWEAFKNIERAGYQVSQSEWRMRDALATVILDSAERYIDVLSSADNLALVKAEKETVENQLLQFERLYEKGMVRITDLLDVQTKRDTIVADGIEAQGNLDIAKEAMAELTGRFVQDYAAFPDKFSLPVLDPDADWVKASLANNLQLNALTDSLRAAEANYRRMKAGHLPTLDFQLSYSDSDIGFDNSEILNGTQTTVAALNINIPIYSGGTTSARAREAFNQWQMEKLEYERLSREVSKQAREAEVNARSSLERITANQYRVNSAEKSYEAMNTSFKLGAVTVSDVVESLQQSYQAKRDLQFSRYNYLKSWLRLKYLSGELTLATVEDINRLLNVN